MKYRFVDKIVSYENKSNIRGLKAVSFEEEYLQRPLGLKSTVPFSLMVEALFQLGNWLIILSTDFKRMGLLGGFKKIEFTRLPSRKALLELEVDIVSWIDEAILMQGTIHEGGEMILRGTACMAILDELANYCSPGDMRVLFGQLYNPVKASAFTSGDGEKSDISHPPSEKCGQCLADIVRV